MTDGPVMEALVLRLVREAVDPYARDVDRIRHEADRNAVEAKRDAERAERHAEEDRQRLVASLKEDAERHAEEVAERVVARIMTSLGLDADKPADFVRLMAFVKDLHDTLHDARKHGLTVIVGLLTMGLATWIWTAFKGSLLK